MKIKKSGNLDLNYLKRISFVIIVLMMILFIGNITGFMVLDTSFVGKDSGFELITGETTFSVMSTPSVSNIIINSTSRENTTNENLTGFWDIAEEGFANITIWYLNNESIEVLYLPFENNSNATLTEDYSTNRNDGNVSGAVYQSTGGYDGFGAYFFNPNDGYDYISIPNEANYDFERTDSFSAFMWVNLNTTNVAQFLIAKIEQTAPYAGWEMVINTTGSVEMRLNNDGAGGANTLRVGSTTNGIDDSTWHHIGFTYEGCSNPSCVKFYIDGSEDGTETISNTLTDTILNNNQVNIGRREKLESLGTKYAINGSVDDVRIYDRILSNEQIKFLWEKKTNILSSEETSVGNIWHYSVTPVNASEKGSQVNSSYLEVLSSAQPKVSGLYLNSTLGTNKVDSNLTINWTVSDFENDNIKNITKWNLNNNSIEILIMPFEGGSNTTYTKDYSDSENDGDVLNLIYCSDCGYDGFGAYNFTDENGDRTYINLGSDASLKPNEMTISAWIKTEEAGPQRIISSWVDNLGISKERYVMNVNYFVIRNSGDTGNSVIYLNDTTNPFDGNWHHITVISDGTVSNTKMYFDGYESAGGNVTDGGDGWTSYTDAEVILGDLRSDVSTANNPFNGTMDDVRIYDRVLSNEQIKLIFENKTYILSSNELTVGDYWTANVTANDGTSDSTTQGSNAIVIITDTCTYSSGNWNIDCSDNCEITSDVNLEGNNIYFTNTGEFYVKSNIENYGLISLSDDCKIVMYEGGKLGI